jgi:hypothetical protein
MTIIKKENLLKDETSFLLFAHIMSRLSGGFDTEIKVTWKHDE